MKKLLIATLLSASLPAMAVTLNAGDLQGNSFVDYSTDGLLALDVNALNTGVLTFSFSLSASEIAAGSVAFNTVVNNYIPTGIPGLKLDFGSLAITAGSVQSAFNSGANGAYGVAAIGSGQYVAFNSKAPTEYFGVLVGDPYGGGLTDWSISTSGLVAGQEYAFSLQAVPEPTSIAMLLAGLGLLGIVRRRA
ncbi:PEP-CTERM sorting domain-containing protein [Viridibacterium curvum]|uniref:Ice-binding protein C-terminal domain-containing protein n=1 Tax=Viridibacterium curvum TaxID=1101404 RepID=A0ABP9QQ60_9RHOO